MSITETIMRSAHIKKYIKESLKNNWLGTPWEHYQPLTPKHKGGLGEMLIEEFMVSHGHVVKPALDTGHDRIVDGIKTEAKFSLANSNTKKNTKLIDPNSFMINHISVGKSWEKLIFFGINPAKDNPNVRQCESDDWAPERVYIMDKAGFVAHVRKKKTFPFAKQQSGQKGRNDDWMVAGSRAFEAFTELPFVKEYKGGSF